MPGRKLVKKLSPEEEELQRKKKELRALEDSFAELELTLNALRVDVGAFLFSVQSAVGERLLEEANLRRRLADALLVIEPDNKRYFVFHFMVPRFWNRTYIRNASVALI